MTKGIPQLEFVDYGEIKRIEDFPYPEDNRIHLAFKRFKNHFRIYKKTKPTNELVGNTESRSCSLMHFTSPSVEKGYSQIKGFCQQAAFAVFTNKHMKGR